MNDHQTLDILDRLCAFDTTSHKSNLDLISYCHALLDAAGFEVQILPNADGTKANLHAVAGNRDGVNLMLAGHTDVVPVSGQDWSGDPFRLRREGGQLIARGAADMKGFDAAALSFALSQNWDRSSMALHVLLTYDEETGCFGARDVQGHMRRVMPPASLCIVGEPTGMVPIVAHKGIRGMKARLTGSEGHAAQIAGKANAIHFAAELIQYLLAQGNSFAKKCSLHSYATPFTTIQTGTITGGQARNMIAKQCEMEFEFRHLPEHSSKAFLDALEAFLDANIRPRMQALQADARVEVETLSHVPAFKATSKSRLLSMLSAAQEAQTIGYWDGVTEAGYYARCGLDTIVCGPGSLSQAHQPDEEIREQELAECRMCLSRIAAGFAGQ